jgi:hypothetical protein
MRASAIILAVVLVAAWAGQLTATVLDEVNIGMPGSEVGHNLVSWGAVRYGDLHDPPGPYGAVEVCRGIDCPDGDPDYDGTVWAEVTLDFGTDPATQGRCLTLRHLEGQAVDGFELYIRAEGEDPPGTLIYSYPGDAVNTDLVWHMYTDEFVMASGPTVLHLVSTGEHWSGWDTYGQMYFDWFIVEDVCSGSPVFELTWSRVKALFR